MMHLARRLLGYLALTGFVVSLGAHAWTALGNDVASQIPQIWLLHVGMFVVFVPLVFFSRYDLGSEPREATWTSGLPGWVKTLGLCILAYAALNFLLVLGHTGGGSPVLREGKFVLLNHGKVVREITKIEYAALTAAQVRGFSGLWLVFYFWPAAYFLLRKA
ncbi:MAG: hypothetical protein GX856_13050 [Gammaproteobacteria bacterium]|jgi:hypothetical protein|nr:hypothetical protein [Gammaproteobacteria bacterium]